MGLTLYLQPATCAIEDGNYTSNLRYGQFDHFVVSFEFSGIDFRKTILLSSDRAERKQKADKTIKFDGYALRTYRWISNAHCTSTKPEQFNFSIKNDEWGELLLISPANGRWWVCARARSLHSIQPEIKKLLRLLLRHSLVRSVGWSALISGYFVLLINFFSILWNWPMFHEHRERGTEYYSIRNVNRIAMRLI